MACIIFSVVRVVCSHVCVYLKHEFVDWRPFGMLLYIIVMFEMHGCYSWYQSGSLSELGDRMGLVLNCGRRVTTEN